MMNFKTGFPILEEYLYANTASSGLIHESTIDWRRRHDLEFLKGASNMRMESTHIITETREALGDFFGCAYENVALVQNFSLGLNMLLEGLDKGNKVLLLENDYPSVNWSFENRGFPISYATIDANLEENIHAKIKNDRISILALSLIQWVNGILIDLDFISRLKNEFPTLLIIADGTQFCGTTNFDLGRQVLMFWVQVAINGCCLVTEMAFLCSKTMLRNWSMLRQSVSMPPMQIQRKRIVFGSPNILNLDI